MKMIQIFSCTHAKNELLKLFVQHLYCVCCKCPIYITLYCYITALQLYESLSPVVILRLSFYSDSNCHTHTISACLAHTHFG